MTTPHDVEEAVVEEKRSLSIVWLIPIVALLVGGFVAWRAFSARGPEITITFKTAEGLEAGKTKIKYKDVEVGLLESVELKDDLSGVVCTARMVPGAEKYLREKTQFWVVRPRISGGQVSGLETLLAGAYIGVDPFLDGKSAGKFVGLETAPVVTVSEAGRYFVLRSSRTGALEIGSPVFFQHIAVGTVVSSDLAEDDDTVTTRVFVNSPYDRRVHTNSRFWNASGIDIDLDANGLSIDTQSLISILVGGIAFESPAVGEGAKPVAAAPEAVFALYQNRQAANRRHYTNTRPYRLYFDQTVRGLSIGAPVEFRGIPVGEVSDIDLEYDPERARAFRIAVTANIEPDRFTSKSIDTQTQRASVDRMVAQGLRAQLRSGSLLTGQLVVALDLFPDAEPARVDWAASPPLFPTTPASLEEITNNLTRLADRLGKVPVEQIGADLRDSLRSLSVTLKRSEDTGPALKAALESAQRTLQSANALIGPDSTVNNELRRTLLELSEAARALTRAANQIESQPDSLIWGKKGSE